MKIHKFIIGLMISFSALSQDYSIIHYDAKDYIQFTFEEMEQMLGENSVLIPQYRCNGKDEFDPLRPPLRMNPLRDSLKIKSPTNEEIVTYRMGVVFNSEGKKINDIEDLYTRNVVATLKSLETIGPARKLIRYLEKSYFPLMIKRGENSFRPQIVDESINSGIFQAQAIRFLTTLKMSKKGIFQDIGAGGAINWSTGLETHSIESDGTKRLVDFRITLAHELYHAFDSIRGLLDMGKIEKKGAISAEIHEYRAVYFENLIRKKLGFKYRKFYRDHENKDQPENENLFSMLTPKGKPINMPGPCL